MLESEIGIVIARTGRQFFNDPAMETQLLDRERSALVAADAWATVGASWVCLENQFVVPDCFSGLLTRSWGNLMLLAAHHQGVQQNSPQERFGSRMIAQRDQNGRASAVQAVSPELRSVTYCRQTGPKAA